MHPYTIAISFKDQQLTYRELDKRSNQVAYFLQEKGVREDSLVAIHLDRSLELVIGILGILKAGGAYVPIDPSYPVNRVSFIINDSNTSICICRPGDEILLKSVTEVTLLIIDDALQAVAGYPRTEVKAHPLPQHLAYIIYTSGSTGVPKGVMIDHQNCTRLFKTGDALYDFNPHDIWTMFHSHCFDFSVWEIFGAFLSGGKLVVVPYETARNIPQFAAMVLKESVTVLNQTPGVFYLLMAELLLQPQHTSLRYIIFGGESLAPFKLKEWKNTYPGTVMVNMYGITETTVHVTFKEITDQEIEEGISNVGKAIPTLDCYILDENGAIMHAGEKGQLHIAGEGLARGYLNNIETTHQKFVDNTVVGKRVYKSGDLGRWLSNGDIEYLGRMDDQVKIRGYRIELAELEHTLLRLSGIDECKVILTGDENKVLTAYYVSKRQIDAAEARRFMSDRLPEYLVPTYYVQIPRFHLNSNGKIDKGALPKPNANQDALLELPKNETEKKLIAIWSDILSIPEDKIGVNSNFFEIGGHSLRTTILATSIEKEFKVIIPLREIFTNPDIKSIAKFILSSIKIDYSSIVAAEKRQYYPLSPAQKRLYFLQSLKPGSTSYNVPLFFSISNEIKIPQIEKAFRGVVKRHESLRTTFITIENEPFQKIRDSHDFSLQHLEVVNQGMDDSMISQWVRPFDMSRDLLMRGCVIETQAKKILAVDIHHIIADGTSIQIIINDLTNAIGDKELKPLRIHYKDFSTWQNQLDLEGIFKKQEEYWVRKIASTPLPVLDLPLDFVRPLVFTFKGAYHEFTLNEEAFEKFRKFCNKHKVTPFIHLLGCLNVLLQKYSGQEDIIVGNSIFGRPHADLQQIPGMFVNELAIRNYPARNKTYLTFIQEVKKNCIEAFENQDYQFDDLVRKLKIERDPSRNALFDVLLSFQNYEDANKNQTGNSPLQRLFAYNNPTTKFDLSLYAFNQDDRMHLWFEYCTDLFRADSIARLSNHFLHIIEQVSRTPDLLLSAVSLHTPAEADEVINKMNATAAPFPSHKTIINLFNDRVKREPGKVATVVGKHFLTFSELDKRSNQLGNYLQEKKGIGPDHLVAVLMDRSIEYSIAIMGILKAGAGYLPLSVDDPLERVKTILDDAEIDILISGKKKLRILNQLLWECNSLKSFICLDTHLIMDEVEVDNNASITKELWEIIGKQGNDAITKGGWMSSYTGLPISGPEMDEYAENIYQKLSPFLNKTTRVLEIGCASGISTYKLARQVGCYCGTDISDVVIEENIKQAETDGIDNVSYYCLAAHELDRIGENDFDIVILNSVVQHFQGHNYLRKVLDLSISKLKAGGLIFLGDLMDLDKKDELVQEMMAYKVKSNNRQTKVDWSEELFLSQSYLLNLQAEFKEVAAVSITPKIFTIENELTKFRFDAIININKQTGSKEPVSKIKSQEDWSHISYFSTAAPALAGQPDNICYVIYTSGTTGVPKGVVIEHASLVNRLHWMNKYFNLDASDHILHKTPYTFDVSVWELFLFIFNGAKTVYIKSGDEKDPRLIVDTIYREGITILHFVPSMLKVFLQYVADNYKIPLLHSLKSVVASGEALEPEQVALFCKLMTETNGTVLYNLYGPTEATVDVSSFKCEDSSCTNIPIGLPIDNTELHVLDKYKKPQPVGITGELHIGGVGLSRGYLNNVLLTAEKFIKNPLSPSARLYKSGDLTKRLPNGNILYLGRLDNQVKVRGYRIELSEIENTLRNHNAITDCKVLVIHQGREKNLAAYYISEQELSPSDLKNYLSEKLPEYMVPSHWLRMEKFPLSSNGKIDRKAFPNPSVISNRSIIAPKNLLQRKLIKVWGDVLKINQDMISTQSNFFDLGGHSLKAITLLSMIHKTFNVDITLQQVFQFQTVEELSQCIMQAEKIDYSEVRPVEKKQYYPLSSAQKRLFVIQNLQPGSYSYNMPLYFALRDDISVEHLNAAFNKLFRKHESLRTSFLYVDSKPVQKVFESVRFEISVYEAAEEQTGRVISQFVRPFNLSKDILLRACIINVHSNGRILCIDMHHIIADGTSGGIFFDDLYAFLRNADFRKAKLQYKDFAEWQNKLMPGEKIKNQRNYWKEQFFDKPAPVDLITDFPRPAQFTFKGDKFEFFLEEEVVQKLSKVGADDGTTLFMHFLTILNVLFFKYTGQEDVVIGTGVAGRRHSDLQGIVGMFVNLLPMRNRPRGSKSYAAFLKEVTQNCLNAFENQDIQFEDLVDSLGIQRDPSRNPLFDICMVVQNYEHIMEHDLITNNIDSNVDYANLTSKFDLTFFVCPREKDTRVIVEYYSEIFKKDTIKALCGHLLQVMDAVVKDPYIQLTNVELLASTSESAIVDEYNSLQSGGASDKPFIKYFEEQSLINPDGIALAGGNEYLSYKRVDEKASQLANYLRGEYYFSEEHLVGIYMSRSLNQLISLLAVLKCGSAFIPIDPSLPFERIKQIMNDSMISLMISEKAHVFRLNKLQWECPAFDAYICLDSMDIHAEDDSNTNLLMNTKLWDFVAEEAEDPISMGGWKSSYTGSLFSAREMVEYADNVFEKIRPFLNEKTKVLEIGCASGITMYRVAPFVGLYYGTDLSSAMITKNAEKVSKENFQNIKLKHLEAFDIDKVEEGPFDLIIINSVIQAFHGHNYLRKVIKKCIALLNEGGRIFIGDVMDQDRKDELVQSIEEFKENNRDEAIKSKTNFSSELFASKGFFEDLQYDFDEIGSVAFSNKIFSIENELTTFRYDVLIQVDKKGILTEAASKKRIKHQFDSRALVNYPSDRLDISGKPGNAAYAMYTSGTSGVPKAVIVPQRGVSNLIEFSRDQFDITPEDRILQFYKLSFDAAVFEIVMALSTGASLHLIKEEDILNKGRFEAQLERKSITILVQPPVYLNLLDPDRINTLRVLITGGTEPSIEMVYKWKDKLRYYNAYGPTEGTVCATAWDSAEELTGSSVPIGKPIRNTRVSILSRDNQLQPVGIAGELCFSGDLLARGYLNNVELTHQKFVNHPLCNHITLYRSGDMARWLPNGDLGYLGRIDSQVKLRGNRVELAEIENILLKYRNVKQCVVLVSGEETDKLLYAYYTSIEEFSAEELKSYLSRHLPDYMVPSYIERLRHMPLTTGGKVDKKRLPDPQIATATYMQAPTNEREAKLLEIWVDILKVNRERVGIESDFFELGGHSLRATILVAKIYEEFRVTIPLSEIFLRPTIKSLGNYILASLLQKKSTPALFGERQEIEI